MRHLVIVTGPPGAGKTSLAAPLARHLGSQLIAKDAIKEALDDAVSPGVRDRAWSQTVGRATYDVMWTIAPCFEEVVLECNFYPQSAEHRRRILQLHPSPVEVYCRCSPELARQRYRSRAGARHPVHVELDLPLARFSDWDRPMDLGPVISVDASGPVNVATIADQVRALL